MFKMQFVYQFILVAVGVNGVSFEAFTLDKYHVHREMAEFLEDTVNKNPNLSRMYSIGKSFEGRDLWVIEISAGEEKSLRPNVKLIGNIHGNEPVGREILLQLTKYLVDGYNQGDESIRSLLDFARVHILPSMNPDGFAYALNHTKEDQLEKCKSSKGRNNIRDLDLNRNFPELHHVNRAPLQPETKAVMDWMSEIPFVLSASLHGGALVANYPFDSRKEDTSEVQEPNLTPDDDVFKHLATLYSCAHPTMHRGEPCPGPFTETFPGGITNGAAWYHLSGGMQDYNYVFHGCMELTLEISCCKFPNPSDLPKYWEDNKEPLLSFLAEARRGIRGVMVDARGAPIPNAVLHVRGRGVPFFTSADGEFWRILLPNAYFLQVHAEGYQNKTVPIHVREPLPNQWSQFINITLLRVGAAENLGVTWGNASKTDETNYPSAVISENVDSSTGFLSENSTDSDRTLSMNHSSSFSPPETGESTSNAEITRSGGLCLILLMFSLSEVFFFNC